MDQRQMEEFMAAQVAAILASGLEFEDWIEQHAAAFRQEWEQSHTLH